MEADHFTLEWRKAWVLSIDYANGDSVGFTFDKGVTYIDQFFGDDHKQSEFKHD